MHTASGDQRAAYGVGVANLKLKPMATEESEKGGPDMILHLVKAEKPYNACPPLVQNHARSIPWEGPGKTYKHK